MVSADGAVHSEPWPVLCRAGQDTLLSQCPSLSTKVYKWIPATGDGSLRDGLASIKGDSRFRRATNTGYKRRLDGPLGS